MSQIAQGSYKTAVTVGQIRRPSGIGSQELQPADQNTLQENIIMWRNFSAVYPGHEEKT